MSLKGRIEAAISRATGREARIRTSEYSPGGSINDSRRMKLADGREFFVKTHDRAADYPGMFQAEYEALRLLAAPGVIRVPEPIAWEEDFIILESIRMTRQRNDWQELMGRRLARLHLETRHNSFGLDRDNYLGTTSQPNRWSDDWVEFWRDRRLGWQLQLYAKKTAAQDPLLKLGDQLLERLDDIVGGLQEPAVLLHGDLWSGNAAADENGEPVIFDPASYYGHREAELGMMRLFGGFGPDCEAAYAEIWPLADGSDARITLYRLYHELNHLNLFGSGYYAGCISTMQRLLQVSGQDSASC